MGGLIQWHCVPTSASNEVTLGETSDLGCYSKASHCVVRLSRNSPTHLLFGRERNEVPSGFGDGGSEGNRKLSGL